MYKYLIVMFCVWGIWHSCTNSVQQVIALSSAHEQPDQIGDSVSLSYIDTAGLRVVMRSRHMRVFAMRTTQPRTEMDSGIHVIFYTMQGKPQAELYARKAIRYTSEKRSHAMGQVVLRNQQGEQLETEALSWDEQSGMLSTDAPVKITREDEVLFGNGLTGNSDFSKYEMRNITGRVKLKL